MKGPLRLLLLLGLAAIGLLVFREVPRDVTLVYAIPDPGSVRRVEVDVRAGDAALRHAELRFPSGAPERIEHPVKLRDGAFVVTVRVWRASGSPSAQAFPITITESGPVVLPVSASPSPSD